MNPLADDDPRDPEPLGEHPLWGKGGAYLELASQDSSGELVEDVVGRVSAPDGGDVGDVHHDFITWLPSWRKGYYASRSANRLAKR